MSKLYETIVQLCAERGVNITELCRQSGASRGSLTDLKMGRKASLSAATISKIATYFGVSVDYLLSNEKEPATDSDGFRLEDDIDLTDVDIAFLGGFKELTEENQATIRDMVRIMRERQKE